MRKVINTVSIEGTVASIDITSDTVRMLVTTEELTLPIKCIGPCAKDCKRQTIRQGARIFVKEGRLCQSQKDRVLFVLCEDEGQIFDMTNTRVNMDNGICEFDKFIGW